MAANTLANAVDKIFAASLSVLRENAVMPRLVFSDYAAATAQQGDAITIRVPSAKTVDDVGASHTPKDATNGVTAKVVTLPLDTWKRSSINLTDKEAHEIAERTGGFLETEGGEAVRALANYVDKDILGLAKRVSNATGTAGQTPFGTNSASVNDAIACRKILAKNNAPNAGRYVVLDPDAEERALRIGSLHDASQRRTTPDTLTTGLIGRVLGMDFYMDQNIEALTPGSGAKAVNLAAGYAVGATSITVDGQGTFKDGELVSFGGTAFSVPDAYAVKGDVAAGDTTINLHTPLRKAIANDDEVRRASTAAYVSNLAFHRSALAIASRVPTAPDSFTGGQMMRQAVDPVSGLTLTLTVFRQEYQTKWEWSILYGVQAVRPELCVRLLG